jgi:hypothetical protein
MDTEKDISESVFDLLDGVPMDVIQAFANTLRHYNGELRRYSRDIEWRLGRIADEYCTTDLEDGIAIAQDSAAIAAALSRIEKNIERLERTIAALQRKEAGEGAQP